MKLGIKVLNEESKRIVDSERLKELGYSVEFIFNLNPAFWGTEYHGVKVISPFQAINEYKAGNVDKIVLPGATVSHAVLDEFIDEQLRFGVAEEDICFSTVELYNDDEGEEFIDLENFGYLDYMEFHTNDHCNLNCKNCNNYSNLVDHEVFTDFDQFSKDIARMKDLSQHIDRIRILGGEPLLNKELYRFVELMREKYKYAEIRIVTNGILIKTIDDRLIDTMRDMNAMFEISAYPPMWNKMDEISIFLKEKGVQHRIGWIANSFRPPLFEKEYGYPLTTVDCNCIHLRNGKIARCPLVQYLDYYNPVHGTSYDGSDGLIEIYEEGLTSRKMWDRLQKSFNLCNRCGFWRKDLPGASWDRD